jgi:beta-lactamase class A
VRRIAAIAACLAFALLGGRVAADTALTPQAALARLFTAQHVDAGWFTQAFLQQASAAQVEAIVASLRTQMGAYQRIEPQGAKYSVIFAHGTDTASIALDQSGLISGLFFEVPQPTASSLEGAVAAFRDLPGRVSLLVEGAGATRAALAPDQTLAVGSTFKLAVLNALKKKIDAGTTSWQSIIKLQARDKSLPSGVLQTWPDGAPLTVYAMAALMISQSDNTAADSLLLYARRGDVEAFGYGNRPFLTTREAFILKDPKNAALLQRFRAGDEAQKRALLAQVDALPLPDPDIFAGGELADDIEWFFSTRELCQLMSGVAALPFMSINPGVADTSDWQRVAYKGGSEPGVLNLTTWLVARSGKSYCVSATWNDDKPLDETKFFGLYKSLLATLKT